ncbi:hypothetical protein N8D55_03975 [Xanthomonas hortorum pv. pelargonii]|nr:hypothetical protein N8D55_03975 [Xanthomonas hortorum pv. pelargonii]
MILHPDVGEEQSPLAVRCKRAFYCLRFGESSHRDLRSAGKTPEVSRLAQASRASQWGSIDPQPEASEIGRPGARACTRRWHPIE